MSLRDRKREGAELAAIDGHGSKLDQVPSPTSALRCSRGGEGRGKGWTLGVKLVGSLKMDSRAHRARCALLSPLASVAGDTWNLARNLSE